MIRKVKGNGAGEGRVDDVFTALDCQIQCQLEDECNAFIWNDADHAKNPNTCWMKKGTMVASYFKPKQHRHSGPKYCPGMDM